MSVNRASRTKTPCSPFLNARFGAAVQEFGLALTKTSSIQHRGHKGGAREEELRKFFQERLPTNFAVVEGEVVDLMGNTSPQLDMMFYDQSVNFALISGSTHVLPAEAFLCSIEIKSLLPQAEIDKSIVASGNYEPYNPMGEPSVALTLVMRGRLNKLDISLRLRVWH
jgi:hypothetical protein